VKIRDLTVIEADIREIKESTQTLAEDLDDLRTGRPRQR